MTDCRWLGLDVGGANLKASEGQTSVSHGFALWRDPAGLTDALQALVAKLPNATALAATMTGELADCYATKAEGVHAIVEALETVADGRPLRLATNDDRWLTPGEARADPPRVAAANWRVFARAAAEALRLPDALVIDVGSTTTDITPIRGGLVAADGVDDTSRLIAGELLYIGVRRTPVCALVDTLPVGGTECPVANELFATTADAWLLVGETDPSDLTDTADGRPLDARSARARLARCVCADTTSFTAEDAQAAAHRIVSRQVGALAEAMQRAQAGGLLPVVAAGEGEFLVVRAQARLGVSSPLTRCSASLGESATVAGPAWAAARMVASELAAFHE
ncbi:MAG: hydantoinase/oxoprolinase family protein [Planctomycetota bacterium]